MSELSAGQWSPLRPTARARVCMRMLLVLLVLVLVVLLQVKVRQARQHGELDLLPFSCPRLGIQYPAPQQKASKPLATVPVPGA